MRVSGFVRLAQSSGADVRINLRCRQTLVSQQFLHTSQICPAVQQMSCKAVSQGMRRSLAGESGQCDVLFQHPSDAASGQAATEAIQKQCILVRLVRIQIRLADIKPAIQSLERIASHRRNSFFSSLSHDTQYSGRSVQITKVETDNFADTKTRGVDRFENGSISQSVRFGARRREQQTPNFIRREKVREFSAGSRRDRKSVV